MSSPATKDGQILNDLEEEIDDVNRLEADSDGAARKKGNQLYTEFRKRYVKAYEPDDDEEEDPDEEDCPDGQHWDPELQECVPNEEPEYDKPNKFPIPPGFTIKDKLHTDFKPFEKHKTCYRSGGCGPSERWKLNSLPKTLNILAGYEFKIGPMHGQRGYDNVDLRFRGGNHRASNGGWYIPFIEWNADGSAGGAGVGKEYPHPHTTHLDFNVKGQTVKVPNIKDGDWHGFLAACYNDKNNVPTIYLWYNKSATGKIEGYQLLGISKDTGNMIPGPILTEIGMKGGKKQSLQIRMDEVQGATIRNAFAAELDHTPD